MIIATVTLSAARGAPEELALLLSASGYDLAAAAAVMPAPGQVYEGLGSMRLVERCPEASFGRQARLPVSMAELERHVEARLGPLERLTLSSPAALPDACVRRLEAHSGARQEGLYVIAETLAVPLTESSCADTREPEIQRACARGERYLTLGYRLAPAEVLLVLGEVGLSPSLSPQLSADAGVLEVPRALRAAPERPQSSGGSYELSTNSGTGGFFPPAPADPDEQPPIIVGRLAREAIESALSRSAASLRYCYTKGLDGTPLDSAVVVRFTVARDGTVSTASVAATEQRSPEAERCLLGHVSRMVFPAPADGGVVFVSYSLRLSRY